MKTVFYSLILFIYLFIYLFVFSTDNIRAKDFVDMHELSYACHYKSDNYEFYVVYETRGLFSNPSYDVIAFSPKKSFEINGSKLTNQSSWSGKQLQVYGEKRNLTSKDKCYNYMYFDQKKEGWINGFFNGNTASDTIYFGDEQLSSDEIKKLGINLTLKKVEYSDSSNYAILNEMVCTYKSNTSELIDLQLGLAGLDLISYKIKFDPSTGAGKYEVRGNKFGLLTTRSFNNKDGDSGTYEYISLNTIITVVDHFHVRLFWNSETGQYTCPSTILVGTESKIGLVDKQNIEIHYSKDYLSDYLAEPNRFSWTTDRGIVMYQLNTSASYINYTESKEEQGEICTFKLPNQSGWVLSLQENIFPNDNRIYQSYFHEKNQLITEVDIDVPSGMIFDDCSKLPEVYTDCLNKSSCKISDSNFDGSTKLISDGIANSEDSSTVTEATSVINGERYKQLMCSLSGKFKKAQYAPMMNNTSEIKIYDLNDEISETYRIDSLDCLKWGYSSDYECFNSDCSNIDFTIGNQISEIKKYCNQVLEDYLNNTTLSWAIRRKEECQSFDTFYNDLVKKAIIRDLTVGCDFVTSDLKEKLIWILDLIKIAGPVLALGLGTLDFVKAIASGDSDKEMKNAFKRFSTRIAAAVLLFIVPLILAVLMDTFLGNKEGYDPDNPFCNLVDWNEK